MTNATVIRTPLLAYRDHSHNTHAKIFLKPENLQPFGSYKIRGVLSAVRVAPPELLVQGLSAASAGNMAQAVAFVAQTKLLPCRIFVPITAPEIKKAAIRRLGAELIELPFTQLWEMVAKPNAHHQGLFMHPIFTPGLTAGYSEIASELLTDRPSLDAVVIPFGVGGLTLGMAHTLKTLKPEIRIYASEPETAAPLKASLRAGKAMRVERRPSFVDAIGTPEVLEYVFAAVRHLLTDSLVVSLAEIQDAVASLAVHSKLVCEGAAAASLAAGLKLARENPGAEIACILTGGNLDSAHLLECLNKGARLP